MNVKSEERMKQKLNSATITSNLIQAIAINANPTQLTYAYLLPDSHGFDNNSIEFVIDEPQISSDIVEDEVQKFSASGLVRHQ